MIPLISDEVNFRAKEITRKRGTLSNYIRINPSRLVILNVYVPKQQNCEICKGKTIRTGKEIEKRTIIIEAFNTLLSKMGRTTRQKSSKDTEEFNTINQWELIDICRTFYPTRAEYTFFSNAHRIYTKINYIQDHKINCNKFKFFTF